MLESTAISQKGGRQAARPKRARPVGGPPCCKAHGKVRLCPQACREQALMALALKCLLRGQPPVCASISRDQASPWLGRESKEGQALPTGITDNRTAWGRGWDESPETTGLSI